jgi:DNA polymerase-3 subunit beta
MDVLGVIHEGQVTLETTTSSSPGVIRPVGSDSYVHIIMPMFVGAYLWVCSIIS